MQPPLPQRTSFPHIVLNAAEKWRGPVGPLRLNDVQGAIPDAVLGEGEAGLHEMILVSVSINISNGPIDNSGMDVIQGESQVTLSLHSQPEMRKLKFLYFENDVDIQVTEILSTMRIDRRLSALKEFECLQCQPMVSKAPDFDEEEIFRRQVVDNQQEPPRTVSLLVRDKVPKMVAAIRVYFFDTRQYRLYDRMEIESTMSAGSFINHIVEDYCTFFLGLIPNLDSRSYYSFDLKLADHDNKHDPVLEPIAY